MPAETAYNIWTFRPDGFEGFLYLTGDQLVRRGGLEPDAWTFTIPYTELEKLPALADVERQPLEGVLEMWCFQEPDLEATADVTLGLCYLVNLEPDLIGREPGDTEDKTLSYQITIVDHRHGFVEPRGGRLMQGLLNRDPLPAGETLYTNKQLIEMCGVAMGVTLTVGTGPNDVEPMREVDWACAHAPSALQELLEHTGHVYAPLISGQAQVMKPGNGSGPTVAPEMIERFITYKSIDRRPLIVVFTSAPQGKIHTYNESADPMPTWKYVVQDPEDDLWKPLDEVAALEDAGGAAAVWAAQFSTVEEAARTRMREQLYCCIQLDPEDFPPGKVNLLPKWIDLDLYPGTPGLHNVSSSLAVERFDGTFAKINATAPLLAKQVVPEANVLIFPHPLMTITVAGITQLNGENATPLAESSLKPRFSVEAWDVSNSRRDYGTYGFQVSGATTLEAISESSAKGYLTGYVPACAIFQSPDLVQVVLNPGSGSTTNRDDMEARAETYARNAVRLDTLAVQEMTIKGFMQVELTGVISEVRYERREPRTINTYNGWHVASRCSGDEVNLGGGSDGISSNIGRQRSRRLGPSRDRSRRFSNRMGTDGQQKLVEPTQPKTREVVWPRQYYVVVGSEISGQKGRYNGTFLAWAPNVSASGALAAANIGTATGTCIIWHTPDIAASESTLEAGMILLAVEGPKDTTSGKVIMITDGGAGGGDGTFAQKLTVSSYSAGIATCSGITVRTLMGHGAGDVIYAIESSNGTDGSGTATHIELLKLSPTTDKYKVIQVGDTTGRLTNDWVRAH